MTDASLTNSGSGSSALATTSATFGFTATAGRLLVFFYVSDAYKSSDISGYTLSTGGSEETNHGHYVYWKIASGSETAASYTIGGAFNSAWWVGEFDQVQATSSLDTSAGQLSGSGGANYATPTVTPSTGTRICIALVGASGNHGELQGGFSGWTNSYVEVGDFHDSPASGTEQGGGIALLNTTGDNTTTTDTTVTFAGFPSARSSTILIFKNGATVTPSTWIFSTSVRLG